MIRGIAAALTALTLVCAGTTANARDYFKGKTVTVISPVPGGSGLDRLIRAFAKHWPKHIPGNPKMIIKNMPGAGGAKGLNFLQERARPDGLTLFMGPWSAPGIIAGDPALRYVPEKLVLIGAGGLDRVSLMRTDVAPGIKKSSDIMKVKSFNVGGRRADRMLDFLGNLSMEMIGANYRFIGGYRGMAKIRPAFMSNEVQACNSGSIGYFIFFKDTMLKDGSAIALWSHPNFDDNGNPVKAKSFPGVPSFEEVYREVHGKMPSGSLWKTYKWYSRALGNSTMTVFSAPETPNAVAEILRASHKKTANDPAYVVPETKRLGGTGIRFISLKEALNIQNTYRDVDAEIMATLKTMTKVGQRKSKKK
ncbi:MAG: hypothetical protein VYA17_02030 [Pseudomonadota bacterium]|nr:hypothetical protein [Pseudomonadota bacterium]